MTVADVQETKTTEWSTAKPKTFLSVFHARSPKSPVNQTSSPIPWMLSPIYTMLAPVYWMFARVFWKWSLSIEHYSRTPNCCHPSIVSCHPSTACYQYTKMAIQRARSKPRFLTPFLQVLPFGYAAEGALLIFSHLSKLFTNVYEGHCQHESYSHADSALHKHLWAQFQHFKFYI